MSNLEFTAIIAVASVLAGLLSALTGLGGSVVVVPMLVLGLGVDLHYAIGSALVSVIAISSGAAIAHVGGLQQYSRRHVPGSYHNIRGRYRGTDRSKNSNPSDCNYLWLSDASNPHTSAIGPIIYKRLIA